MIQLTRRQKVWIHFGGVHVMNDEVSSVLKTIVRTKKGYNFRLAEAFPLPEKQKAAGQEPYSSWLLYPKTEEFEPLYQELARRREIVQRLHDICNPTFPLYRAQPEIALPIAAGRCPVETLEAALAAVEAVLAAGKP